MAIALGGSALFAGEAVGVGAMAAAAGPFVAAGVVVGGGVAAYKYATAPAVAQDPVIAQPTVDPNAAPEYAGESEHLDPNDTSMTPMVGVNDQPAAAAAAPATNAAASTAPPQATKMDAAPDVDSKADAGSSAPAKDATTAAPTDEKKQCTTCHGKKKNKPTSAPSPVATSASAPADAAAGAAPMTSAAGPMPAELGAMAGAIVAEAPQVMGMLGAAGALPSLPGFSPAEAFPSLPGFDALGALPALPGFDAAGALPALPGFTPQAGGADIVANQPAAAEQIGFTADTVSSAYQGMRSGGGHAMRHLIDEGLIPNSGSLTSRASTFERLTTSILTNPTKTFDWRIGNVASRGFAGQVKGKPIVMFVATEGPYQGRVLSAIVPDAAQIAQWGL